jgi:Homeodomain-like domain
VFRAKLILMLAEGASFNAIKHRLQTSAPTIIRWRQRFLESGLDGLDTYHPGQKATVLTPALCTVKQLTTIIVDIKHENQSIIRRDATPGKACPAQARPRHPGRPAAAAHTGGNRGAARLDQPHDPRQD